MVIPLLKTNVDNLPTNNLIIWLFAQTNGKKYGIVFLIPISFCKGRRRDTNRKQAERRKKPHQSWNPPTQTQYRPEHCWCEPDQQSGLTLICTFNDPFNRNVVDTGRDWDSESERGRWNSTLEEIEEARLIKYYTIQSCC